MYVQWFAKGIAGLKPGHVGGISRRQAFDLIRRQEGIRSNWWRWKRHISPADIAGVLNEPNLDRHLHDYANFGWQTPFISVAAGCVEREALLRRNVTYSAIDTALEFATDAFSRPGAVFYGWTIVGLNPAVELSAVSESVRELNVYRRWSPYQLEGEITAKVYIPANQIEYVEWWDEDPSDASVWKALGHYLNPRFEPPDPILNVRDLF